MIACYRVAMIWFIFDHAGDICRVGPAPPPLQAVRLLPPSGAIPRTTSTMPFEFGDVVLVPFPFTSQRASKKRPAVVVSNRAYGTAPPDLIVMAVPPPTLSVSLTTGCCD